MFWRLFLQTWGLVLEFSEHVFLLFVKMLISGKVFPAFVGLCTGLGNFFHKQSVDLVDLLLLVFYVMIFVESDFTFAH